MVGYSGVVLMGLLFSCSCKDDLRELRKSGEFRKACPKFGNAIQPSNRVYTKERVEKLRSLMVNTTVTRHHRPLDAYFIPSQDEHQNEFVEEYEKRLEYISGFSGSYGEAIITINRTEPPRQPSAVLWTDGRYHLQADNQIDCSWKLMRETFHYVPNAIQWLQKDSPQGGIIGVDPKLISQSKWEEFEKDLKQINWTLIEVQINLIDAIWQQGREKQRKKEAFVLEDKYSGYKWTKKVAIVKEFLKSSHADAMIITALDEIAWLLNIRGRDLPYRPFVRSYVLLDMDRLRFYVDRKQLNSIIKYFQNENQVVEIFNYDQVCPDLTSRSQTYSKILIPTSGASHNISNCIPKEKRLFKQSPIILLKAKKNPTEIRGMQRAHIHDATAMCQFLAYFEKMFKDGSTFTEMDVVRLIDEYRLEQPDSLGPSFPTIVAFGSNGALPHYKPTNNTNVLISDTSTLVLDSGGQYYGGTTDVTRTLHFGVPTQEQKEAYTRVLIGQIQLASLTFPSDLLTPVIDVMARAPLWEVGLDYAHGTGHGVGAFSSVHEAPISIYFNQRSDLPENQVLKPGYFLSNEPGYYRESDFGVRLENVMEVIEKRWLRSIHGVHYLGFNVITLVPYEPKLIDLSLLSVHQIRWLNAYNDKIRIHVGQELKRQNFTQGFFWMMDKTNHFRESNSNCVKSTLMLTLFSIWLLL